VKFGQNPISGFREDVVEKKLVKKLLTDARTDGRTTDAGH